MKGCRCVDIFSKPPRLEPCDLLVRQSHYQQDWKGQPPCRAHF